MLNVKIVSVNTVLKKIDDKSNKNNFKLSFV